MTRTSWTSGRGWRTARATGLWAALCLALSPLAPTQAQTSAPAPAPVQIADDAALRAAIAAGVAGQVLELAPGSYEALFMREAGVPAVLRSADPEAPAVLHGLLIDSFDGLVIEDVVLKYRFSPEDAIHIRPFRMRGCRNLTLRGSRIEGDRAHSLGFPHDGKGFGVGLVIRSCDGVRLENNVFTGSWRGAFIETSRNITFTGNEITGHRMDGLGFAQVEGLLIENNHFHDFDRVDVPQDHADMIQFWSVNTTAPSRDITIRNNRFNSGHGMHTQTIFMRNERVDMGEAGPEMFYENITITDNVILNAHAHGITIGETRGVEVRNNTLIQNKGSATGNDPHHATFRPTINVSPYSRDVRIEGNITHGIGGHDGQPDWQVRDNLIVRDIQARMRGLPYGRVFEGGGPEDPADLDGWRILPGGPADRPDIGAQVLRQR